MRNVLPHVADVARSHRARQEGSDVLSVHGHVVGHVVPGEDEPTVSARQLEPGLRELLVLGGEREGGARSHVPDDRRIDPEGAHGNPGPVPERVVRRSAPDGVAQGARGSVHVVAVVAQTERRERLVHRGAGVHARVGVHVEHVRRVASAGAGGALDRGQHGRVEIVRGRERIGRKRDVRVEGIGHREVVAKRRAPRVGAGRHVRRVRGRNGGAVGREREIHEGAAVQAVEERSRLESPGRGKPHRDTVSARGVEIVVRTERGRLERVLEEILFRRRDRRRRQPDHTHRQVVEIHRGSRGRGDPVAVDLRVVRDLDHELHGVLPRGAGKWDGLPQPLLLVARVELAADLGPRGPGLPRVPGSDPDRVVETGVHREASVDVPCAEHLIRPVHEDRRADELVVHARRQGPRRRIGHVPDLGGIGRADLFPLNVGVDPPEIPDGREDGHRPGARSEFEVVEESKIGRARFHRHVVDRPAVGVRNEPVRGGPLDVALEYETEVHRVDLGDDRIRDLHGRGVARRAPGPVHRARPRMNFGPAVVRIQDLELGPIEVLLDAELMLEGNLHRAHRAGEAHEVLEGLKPIVVVAVAVRVQDPGRIDPSAPERVSLASVGRSDVPGGGLEGAVLVGVAPFVSRTRACLEAVAVHPGRVAGLIHLRASEHPFLARPGIARGDVSCPSSGDRPGGQGSEGPYGIGGWDRRAGDRSTCQGCT